MISTFSVRTAILVDGGFYRSKFVPNYDHKNSAKAYADLLEKYCMMHIEQPKENRFLHRIYYYDCPPVRRGLNIQNPFSSKLIDQYETMHGEWTHKFFDILTHKNKFALRLGKLNEHNAEYQLKSGVLKKLVSGELSFKDLTLDDCVTSIKQKGVDMRIGVDITSLSLKHQVDQIILISGDSDFVPAAKLARREGVNFILDNLGHAISSDLQMHIDSTETYQDFFKTKNANPKS